MITYKAFGLYLASDTVIAQVQPMEEEYQPDIMINSGELTEFHNLLPNDIYCLFRKNEFYFEMPEVGRFLLLEGKKIIYEAEKNVGADLLSAYLMGPCMGGILHQRGIYPIHGSCVSNGKYAVVICGESGSGKSTLASEFIARGWKLVTDDVAAVKNIEKVPMISPSYPSQKLWQDSLKSYSGDERLVHSLYARTDGVKFGVDASEYFADEPCSLSLIVSLIADDKPCSLKPINGMEKINCIMKNTYNAFMVLPEERQNFFCKSVALVSKIPMVELLREKGIPSAPKLYEMITSYLEEE